VPLKNTIFAANLHTNTMQKIYHLATCDTCRRILKELDANDGSCALQDIKTEKITPKQLDEIKALAGSYEALFSRNAMKYRSMNLKDKQLTEQDYRNLILEEYTFLKRPVVIAGKEIFIGNAPSVVAAAKKTLKHD